MTSAATQDLDVEQLARWIEPLGRDGFADLLLEWRSELSLALGGGEVTGGAVVSESACAARARRGGRVVLAAVPGADEAAAREAVRRLAGELASPHFPKAESARETAPPGIGDPARWARRMTGLLQRLFEAHAWRAEMRRCDLRRLIVPAGGSPLRWERVLVSLRGAVRMDTRGGPRWRDFAIHVPSEDGGSIEEMRHLLRPLTAPGAAPVAPPDGTRDVLLAEGAAAFLFHEVLSHPLEADAAGSRLLSLARAKVAPRELDVWDEPARLDLFGGYPADEEGTPGRRTPLLSAGHLGGPLRDRLHSDALHPSTGNGRRPGPHDHAAPRGSNVVVGAGGASEEEMIHRLGSGLRIAELDSGAVDPATGVFRLRFSAGQIVQRGRLAQPVSGGILEGDVLDALAAVDPLLGARVFPCRRLGWCARDGKILPAGGEAPSLIVRRLAVRAR